MKKSVRYVLAGTLAAALAWQAAPMFASSHREAPAITESPKIDGTDLYMFRSYEPGRSAFVTIIANYQPLQEPYGGPNYFTMDPDAIYEIHIDNDGDARENLTYQFKFDNSLRNDTGVTLNVSGKTLPIALRHAGTIGSATDANQGETESYSLTLVTNDRRTGTRAAITNASGGSATFAKPIDNIGTKTIANYATYVAPFSYGITIPGCSTAGKVFVGQRAEAFAVNLGPVFDLVNFVPIEGASAPGANDSGGFPGGIKQNRANDDLVGKANITSIALELPIACITGTGNGVIGAWTTASLPQAQIGDPTPTYKKPQLQGGAYVQRSRLGMPLVNELVIGLPQKDLFNAVEPTEDGAVLDYVTNPTFPAILNLLFRGAVNTTLSANFADLAPNNFPRNDLVAAFLTGFTGLNKMSTVTPSEMLRLNTTTTATAQASQSTFGVVGNDLAGFPNGRRPGDDVVDIVLRVAMGRLCHPVPLNGVQTNLGLCTPQQAPTGMVAYTDGAPISAMELQNAFPYLNNPIPGSPN